MCIRDRVDWADGADVDAADLLVAAEEVAEVVRQLGGGAEGCLLYTSDAADERSSVDLGGRRIIKKKKTQDDRVTNDNITTTSTEVVTTIHLQNLNNKTNDEIYY